MKPSTPNQSEPVVTGPTVHPLGTPAADALGPIRLSAGGGDGFEQRLVAASAFDRMPAASRERLARVLGVPSAAAPPTPLERTLHPSPWIKYGALVGLGAFGLLAAMATSRWVAPATPESTTAPALVEVAAMAPGSSPLERAKPELEAAAGPPTPAPPMPALPTRELPMPAPTPFRSSCSSIS